eukprot:m.87370 g.87370  ORF g.87370 m.87370 type:complete len:51 (+) comp36541_c0_seq6:1260-1412(+)
MCRGTKLIAVFIIEKWCWQHLVFAIKSLKLNIYLYMHAVMSELEMQDHKS